MKRDIWITSIAAVASTALLTITTPSFGTTDGHKASPSKRTAKIVSPADLRQSFDRFCCEWIQKLRDREQTNVAQISWTETPDGIAGTYVGYAEEHTCTLTDDKPPVGKIRYEEVVYEKRGSTIQSAVDSPPTALKRYDTLELFSFIKGKWDY